MSRRILVTAALPYANGPLHLGHMLEHIQTDIWVRAMRMQGHDCVAVCAEDAHGTPVMLKAESLGYAPEAMAADMQQQHCRELTDFDIHYDQYHTTHSPENQALANEMYLALKANGDIVKREIQQYYDPEKAMFLSDRMIKGSCPKCHSPDQYGDSCEVCGATYNPTDMIAPRSVLSGAEPILKTSEHCFFQLPHYENMLREWTRAGHLQTEISNKLDEWFQQGLKDWDISRDEPYFGFEIPDEPGKFFYVWLDAPIGYMASFKAFCDQHPDYCFDDYWRHQTKTERYHFIGKDIIYFHALFWPAMCRGGGFTTPNGVFAHGFVTVNGAKMSKSRGNFITARAFLNHAPATTLRYYFASKLTPAIEDIDIQWDDFCAKINADLVGKVINIASRCTGFITKRFNSRLSDTLDAPALLNDCQSAVITVVELYEQRAFARAIKVTMALADRVNQYIDSQKPWQMIKDPAMVSKTHQVCSTGINLFRLIMICLKPVVPSVAQAAETFLQTAAWQWQDAQTLLTSHDIKPFKPLMQRIEREQIAPLADGLIA